MTDILWWECKCDRCDLVFRCLTGVESQIAEEIIEADWKMNQSVGSMLCPDHAILDYPQKPA